MFHFTFFKDTPDVATLRRSRVPNSVATKKLNPTNEKAHDVHSCSVVDKLFLLSTFK